MKNSKLIFMLILLIAGMQNVFASSDVICTYDKYKLEFSKSIDKTESVILYVDGIKNTKKLEIDFEVNSLLDCPQKIYVHDFYLEENPRIVITKASRDDLLPDAYDFRDLTSSDETTRPKVDCGNVKGIPKVIPRLTSLAFTIIQIAVPILLVLMGSIDLFKGITAGKEDEMKKGQQMFIKRLIVGALVFFIIAITKLVVSVIANSEDTNNISSCISCFMSNDCN